MTETGDLPSGYEVMPPPRPRRDDAFPRWPAWYGPAALLAGLVAASLVIVVLEAVLRHAGGSTRSPAATDVFTVLQDLVFVGAAVAFAAMTAPPRPWQFGLRGRPLAQTAGWALLGFLSFWVLWALYNIAFEPHGRQTVTKDIGANTSTAALVGGAVVVLVVVPICEELFFRGFFYRALRSRFNVWWAALIDAIVFGAVHYTGASTLSVLPVLALLGFFFCLIYERTGTIYATMALHSFNNALAYGTGTRHGAVVSAALGAAVLAAAAGAIILTPRGGSAA